MNKFTAFMLSILLLIIAQETHAQYSPSWDYKVTNHNKDSHMSCGPAVCDHEIYPPSIKVKPGKVFPLPGDTICLMPGNYEEAEIWNVFGEKDNPITVMNCGGEVQVDTQFTIRKAAHFNIKGTGSVEHQYGIKILGKPELNGLAVLDLSDLTRDIELSYLDISAINSTTGIHWNSSKPYTMINGEKVYDEKMIDLVTDEVFVQTGSHIHHNYIHDARDGEGIYLGIFGCDPTDLSWGAALEDTLVHDNIVENVGSDGIQVGCSRKNTKIFNNYIDNAGYNPLHGRDVHTKGIQIGRGTTGLIYNNFLNNIATDCFFVQGGPDLEASSNGIAVNIYNNIMQDCYQALIIHNEVIDVVEANQKIVFANNNVINMRFAHYSLGFQVYESIEAIFRNNFHVDDVLINHIVVGTKEYEYGDNITESASLTTSFNEAGFVSEDDFNLTNDSPAIGYGDDARDLGITYDINNTPKSVSFDVGAINHANEDALEHRVVITGASNGRVYIRSNELVEVVSYGHDSVQLRVKNLLATPINMNEILIGLKAGTNGSEIPLNNYASKISNDYQTITIPFSEFGFKKGKLELGIAELWFKTTSSIGELSLAIDEISFVGGETLAFLYNEDNRDSAQNLSETNAIGLTIYEEAIEPEVVVSLDDHILVVEGTSNGRVYIHSNELIEVLTYGHTSVQLTVKNRLETSVNISEMLIGLKAGTNGSEISLINYVSDIGSDYQTITIPFSEFGFKEGKLELGIAELWFKTTSSIGDLALKIDEISFVGGDTPVFLYDEDNRDSAQNLRETNATGLTIYELLE